MVNLGLDRDAYARFIRTLRSSHRIRLHVRIHDHDEKVIDSLTEPIQQVLSGSVQYVANQDVTRSLELTVLDPKGKLNFHSNSPARGAVFADHFLSVDYQVWVPSETSDVVGRAVYGEGEYGVGSYGGDFGAVTMDGDWVSVPVFWGPLTKYSRTGGEVSLEAQGKEALLLAPYSITDSYQLHRGTRLDDAIRRVAEKAGEARFRLPDLPHRLQGPYVVPTQDEPWKILAGGQRLHQTGVFAHLTGTPGQAGAPRYGHRKTSKGGLVAMAPGHQTIGYDGNGRLTVRRLPSQKVLTLAEGRDLLGRPELSFDPASFRNVVVVHGKRLKATGNRSGGRQGNSARRAYARAELHPEHPLSPRAMMRNGEPRELVEFVDTELKTDHECEQLAREKLKHLSQEGVSLSFDCLPFPHLEEHDRIEVRTSEWSITLPLQQWALPLTASSPMTIGRNRKVSDFRRRRGQGQAVRGQTSETVSGPRSQIVHPR